MSRGTYKNVGGVWKKSTPYKNVGGVWKKSVPWKNVGGVWKQCRDTKLVLFDGTQASYDANWIGQPHHSSNSTGYLAHWGAMGACGARTSEYEAWNLSKQTIDWNNYSKLTLKYWAVQLNDYGDYYCHIRVAPGTDYYSQTGNRRINIPYPVNQHNPSTMTLDLTNWKGVKGQLCLMASVGYLYVLYLAIE